MKNRIIKTLLILLATGFTLTAQAQHTFGISGGAGSFNSRIYPKYETKMIIGAPNFGVSWRYYSLPRFVGAVGADLEYMQRGYSFGYAYSTSTDENGMEKREYSFYTRRLNSIMLPLVWQPHVYLANKHLRLYLEAAFTLSYNFGGNYEYEDTGERGDYTWSNVRDNRLNYGSLAGMSLVCVPATTSAMPTSCATATNTTTTQPTGRRTPSTSRRFVRRWII